MLYLFKAFRHGNMADMKCPLETGLFGEPDNIRDRFDLAFRGSDERMSERLVIAGKLGLE